MTVDATAAVAASRRFRLRGSGFALTATASGRLGLFIVGGIILVAILAPFVAPHDPYAQDIRGRLASPSFEHLLGTDALGRDVLSRVIYGARIALAIAIPAVVLGMIIGAILGLTAALFGGPWDLAVLILIDALHSFPLIFLAITIVSIYGASAGLTIVLIAVGSLPHYARIVRILVLNMRHSTFVDAERTLGIGTPRLVVRHIAPIIAGPLFIVMAIDIPGAVAAEAGLSFLGFGVTPPEPSWGVILADGFSHILDSPWPVIGAGGALIIATVGFTLLGERLRDIFDPRSIDQTGLTP